MPTPELIGCPNCGSTMNRGETCPKCTHTEAGECYCDFCDEEEEWFDDEWDDDEDDDYDDE